MQVAQALNDQNMCCLRRQFCSCWVREPELMRSRSSFKQTVCVARTAAAAAAAAAAAPPLVCTSADLDIFTATTTNQLRI
jgi:uncharacterized Rossmann fold enzyme